MNSETAEPFFLLNVRDKRRLIEIIKTIQLGDHQEQVETKLGKPWSHHLARTKKENTPIGLFVTYYIVKWSRDSVNETKDQFVLLRFGNDGRLEKIISHAPGIANRP